MRELVSACLSAVPRVHRGGRARAADEQDPYSRSGRALPYSRLINSRACQLAHPGERRLRGRRGRSPAPCRRHLVEPSRTSKLRPRRSSRGLLLGEQGPSALQTAHHPTGASQSARPRRAPTMDGLVIGVGRRPMAHCTVLYMSDTLPITEARGQFGSLVRRASTRRERITITDHGVPAAVLINAQELADLEDDLAIAQYRAEQAAGTLKTTPNGEVRARLGLSPA